MKRGVRRKAGVALIGAVAIAGLLAPPAAARKIGQIEKYKVGKNQVVLNKGGKAVKKKLAGKVKVVLKSKSGEKSRKDINELVAGAKVLRLADRNDDGKIDKVVLRELPSGGSDCSFDGSEESEDPSEVSVDESWDCDLDYDGINLDISESCSFDRSEDSSSDPSGGDSSRDMSWDCSYDESDDENDFSWDCDYDASESASWEPEGGDSDGDTSFSCSWDSSVPLTEPLFDCAITQSPLGWHCTSAALDQSFGVTLDSAPVGFDPFLDFNEDYVDLDEEDASASCSNDDAGSYSCSFDSGDEFGDCSVDFSFDVSNEPDGTGGDVSGDMSYSCSYEFAEGSNPDDL